MSLESPSLVLYYTTWAAGGDSPSKRRWAALLVMDQPGRYCTIQVALQYRSLLPRFFRVMEQSPQSPYRCSVGDSPCPSLLSDILVGYTEPSYMGSGLHPSFCGEHPPSPHDVVCLVLLLTQSTYYFESPRSSIRRSLTLVQSFCQDLFCTFERSAHG